MTQHDTPTGLLGGRRRDLRRRPAAMPLWARAVARLRAHHFDRRLAVGAPVHPGSATAAHVERLTSAAEREAVAHTLERLARDADQATGRYSSRIPLHRNNIRAAEGVLGRTVVRLRTPQPVSARGVARLRVLLADGGGPVYRCGRGDLEGRLGAALAAL